MMAFDYELPNTPAEREELYGTDDFRECVKIDLENDPASFMLETDSEIVYCEEFAPGGSDG